MIVCSVAQSYQIAISNLVNSPMSSILLTIVNGNGITKNPQVTKKSKIVIRNRSLRFDTKKINNPLNRFSNSSSLKSLDPISAIETTVEIKSG